ncbi:uncharacterized protein HMPREF1541_08152 [Cyphellophora europaea CBS 101466]|uniref:Uncharacterized protein n=1 Tax=Cyphellophora europaea (strain CBS 101466) TaxID=1220924 RepID=W2RKY8_CYPE1|nr:uncharacterized protein HMPREF1541_08152 [Cyphellophora europaea CBS 101466]ETN37162.1 hypothetical protein HMPREF1541_08152 [Cyphellophora europaea CBS 101466]
MSLSVLLAVTTLYILFRPVAGSLPSSAASESVKHDLLLSSWIGSFYMLAGLSAIWYPGTGWLDPEFRVDENVDEPAQLYVFGGGLALLWAGYAIERTRLGKEGRSTLRSEVKQR